MKQEGRREYQAYLLVELQQPGMLRRRKPLCKFQQSPFLQLWNTSLKTPFVASSRVVQASDLQRYPRGSLQEHDRGTSLQFARTSGKNFGNTPSHSWRMDVEKHFLTLYGAEKLFLTWVCWCMNTSHSRISSSTLLNTSEELSHGVWTKFSQPTTCHNTCSNPCVIDLLCPLNICHALHK